MRGPVITPQAWFRDLPDLPEIVEGSALAIYTGTVNGITNLVVRVMGTGLGMVLASAGVFWRFNYDLGVFETIVGEGGNWAVQIIEQSGRDLDVVVTTTLSEVTQDMVLYKFDPST